VISSAEVEARGPGTADKADTYDGTRILASETRVFFTGLTFLTRLPGPTGCDHHPAFIMRSVQWFPFIGLIVGGWGAAWLYHLAHLLPPAVAAAASTGATMWLTGAFHEDGLSDCFDGFGGGWGRTQILR
jgi:adenosylcobinamide-GDP ribazoletransferase